MTHPTTVTPESGERLIEEGLFRLAENGTPRLRGTKCPACGTVFAGNRAVCLACFRVGLEPHDLSDRGEVHSFTTVRQQSPDSLLQPPYTVVQAKLRDGVIVTAPMLEVEAGKVHVGMPIRTKAFRFEEKSGGTVVSYAFVPAEEESA